jgi:NADP-dependent 3-hydroxy acid dehydrogenase YdfG
MSSVFNAKKMNPIDIAKLMGFIISMKDNVAVQDILVEVPDLDWNDIKLE